MAISRNYPGSLELSELQAILDQDESGFGPIEGLEIFGNGPSALTTIVYDDAIELDAPMSILAASEKPPAGRIAYVRGQIQVGGTTRDITSFVLNEEKLLALRCISYFTSFGWTRNQAIGLVASIKFESNFNPSARGDSGTAYGLCQWRGTRQTDFSNMHGAALLGSTFREQLEFIVFELGHCEHVAGATLRATTSISDAATAVCIAYERPAHPTIDVVQRVAYALVLDG